MPWYNMKGGSQWFPSYKEAREYADSIGSAWCTEEKEEPALDHRAGTFVDRRTNETRSF